MRVVLAGRIVGDIEKLVAKVVRVADAMFVIAGVPDFV